MTLSTDVQESLSTANNAYHLFGLSLQVFQAQSGRCNFEDAEKERDILHAHLDSYIDNFMAANRRVQQGELRDEGRRR